MTKQCRCGQEFTPRRKWQRYCSAKCRRAALADYDKAEVSSVRQTKRGWSVTLWLEHAPRVATGDLLSLTVMRSERITPGAADKGVSG